MARKPPRLTLVVTPGARRDLLGIWAYNAESYGPDHADHYVAFLDRETRNLEVTYAVGKPIPERAKVRFVTLRKGRGAGHVVLYHVKNETVEVLRYQHTAQD